MACAQQLSALSGADKCERYAVLLSPNLLSAIKIAFPHFYECVTHQVNFVSTCCATLLFESGHAFLQNNAFDTKKLKTLEELPSAALP